MNTTELQAQPRDPSQRTARALRRDGFVPAVLYGHGTEARCLQLDARDLERALTMSDGTVLMRLVVQGEDEPYNVLLKEVQVHPVQQRILHVDLLTVSMTERIRVSIPVVLDGEDEVAARAAIAQQLLREVQIECLPGVIPDRLHLDVSQLAIGDNLKVADLHVPEGAAVISDPSEVLVTIIGARADQEQEAEEAGDEGDAAETARARTEDEA